MSSLRYLAAKAYADALGASSAALAVVTRKVLQRPPTELADSPTLAVLPDRFRFDPFVGEEVDDANGDPVMVNAGADAVVHVGALEGSLRLWASAKYPVEREQIEDAVLGAHCADDAAPGRLLASLSNLTIAGYATTIGWPIAYQLTDAEWREELVFSERRWSFLSIDVDVPVLVLRKDAQVVTDLVAALTTDLETLVVSDADLANLEEVEQVRIAEDGSLSQWP